MILHEIAQTYGLDSFLLMFYKGKKVGHSDLVIVHDSVPRHAMMYYHTKFCHSASNSIEEIKVLNSLLNLCFSRPFITFLCRMDVKPFYSLIHPAPNGIEDMLWTVEIGRT